MLQTDDVRLRSDAALKLALVLTLTYALIETLAGMWAGSLVLLSDAVHSLSDSVSLGLAALAAWAALRPASPRHSYGFGRAEIIAAFVNAAVMVGVLVWISAVAVQRLIQPQTVHGGAVIAFGVAGLLLDLVVTLIVVRSEQTMNIRAAMLHIVGDLLASFAALVSGVVVSYTGWVAIDPLLSFVICGLILFATVRLLREALRALMEGTPLSLSLEEIGHAIAAVRGVQSAHDLHVWTLSSDRIALSAHLLIGEPSEWQEILPRVGQMLDKRYGIQHVTLQPEPAVRRLQRVPVAR